jgi:hypothetical protein
MYLESEEWAMEDPGDWAVILAEMRKNVQSRTALLLGQVPTRDQSGHHPRIISHKPKQSGSKVYIFVVATLLPSPSELIKTL